MSIIPIQSSKINYTRTSYITADTSKKGLTKHQSSTEHKVATITRYPRPQINSYQG